MSLPRISFLHGGKLFLVIMAKIMKIAKLNHHNSEIKNIEARQQRNKPTESSKISSLFGVYSGRGFKRIRDYCHCPSDATN